MKISEINNAPRPDNAGFTLVEVMMGAAIMALIFVSIFAILTTGLFTSQTSRENLRATQILLDKMEAVRLFNETQLTNTSLVTTSFTNYFCETNNIGMPSVQGTGVQYTGSITITNVPFTNGYSANMQQVTVSVSWVSGGAGNISHNRSMATFFSNPGLSTYISAN